VAQTFNEKQRQVYTTVLAAHDRAISMLAPGVAFKEIHIAACLEIAQGMKDLGLMRGNMEDAVGLGAHAMFFPCGLGHMMGLDVHDMENLGETFVGYDGQPKSDQFGLKSLRLARTLEPGFVLTVEPGVYFIPELMDLWKRKIGSKNSSTMNGWKIIGTLEASGTRRTTLLQKQAIDCLASQSPEL
jgi:Xaa-Pro aminopeptidase